MKRFFCKKSVAIIITTLFLLVGFFSCNIAYAGTTAPANPTCSYDNNTYRYVNADNSWYKIDSTTKAIVGSAIKTDVMQNTYGCSDAASKVETYSIALAKWETENSTSTPTTAYKVWDGFKTVLDYTAGVTGLVFGPTATIIGFLELVQQVLGLFVTISGYLLDMSVNYTVLNISTIFQTDAITSLWTLIRDAMNICFIFMLLYLAIAKILGSFNIKSKTTLINIIMAAVFINFSMFITKILIDAGNLVAIALYNQILSIGVSISGIIFSQLGVINLVKNALSLSGQFNMLISVLLQIAVSLALIYVYLLGAFLLIGRTVMFVLLAITSPVGFVGKVLPGLGGFSDKWWKNLTDQILVAPALMFVLLIAVKLLQSNTLFNIAKMSATASSIEPPAIDVTAFFYYSFVIIVLVEGIKEVKNLSGEVAGMIVKAAGAAAIAGGAVVTGGMALGVAGVAGFAQGATQVAGVMSKSGVSEGLKTAGKKMASGLKNNASMTGNLITGNFDKTGVGGWAQNQLRGQALEGIKTATGGYFDINKIQKIRAKTAEEAKKNLTEQSEGFTKNVKKEQQDLEAKENIITAAGEKAQVEAALKVPKSTEHQQAEATLQKAKEIKDKAEASVKETNKKIEAAPKGTIAAIEATAAHTEAVKTSAKASTDFSEAERKVKEFEEEYKKKQKEAMEEAAKQAMETASAELGFVGKTIKVGNKLVIDSLQKAREANVEKLKEAEQNQQKFIKEKIENGSYWGTLLSGKNRKGLANELRTKNIKKKKTDKKALAEFIDSLGMKPEDLIEKKPGEEPEKNPGEKPGGAPESKK